jgi:3-methylcrotonyl-CoA carboxylase alpha subunit
LSSPHSINLGEASAYLDGDKIIEVAKREGCQAIHPGYGFLSENSEFARKCTEQGLIFIGPPSTAIEAMGSKSESKNIMTAAGVPCVPGYHGSNQDGEYLLDEARKIGFPVLLKAVKGGGGKGMRIARTEEEFPEMLASAKSEARNSFGDEIMLVEKYITTPRHIEVQVFADKHGNCVALGERDCSVQRRHQKILEESPAPHLDESIRQDLWAKARAAALAVGYEGAGTVEFIFDNDTNEFFFMEMNTRLQVEHPVTEMVTGQDLVHWQFVVAEGGKLPLSQAEIEEEIKSRGWAFEARIYAENPDLGFIPDSGRLLHLQTPQITPGVRVDAGFVAGDLISPHYDPMIAKLIVGASTREAALFKLSAALEEYEVVGMSTNIEFLKRLCKSVDFVDGAVETGYIDKHRDELFAEVQIPEEAYVQAALGTLLQEISDNASNDRAQSLGFGPPSQKRIFTFAPAKLIDATPVDVELTQAGPDTFTASTTLTSSVFSLTTTYDADNSTITTYFPHCRLSTKVLPAPTSTDQSAISLFHLGQHFHLTIPSPKYLAKLLGAAEAEVSVRAPMPCKVLKVAVEVGQTVEKGQILLTVESMKMEMVIRAPQAGIVKRIAHGVGDVVKAGTALVEFEEASSTD